jgi:hypothetical protein
MRRKFKTLARKADVTIGGDPATPRHGRSFYYNILTEAQTNLRKDASDVAEEQGSKDPWTVMDHYLKDEVKRRYRRIFFRHYLRRILPDDAYFDNQDSSGYNASFDEF